MKQWRPACLWIHQQIFENRQLLPPISNQRHCMAILKLDKHDEDKEIEFELDYLTSLTTSQRFELMFRKTEELLSLRKKTNARKAVTEIIKRKPD